MVTNPAYVVQDLLSNARYGLGLPASRIDSASFADTASYCAADVRNSDGTSEPRFSLDIVLDTARPIVDHLRDMLSTFRGYLVWSQGVVKLRIAKVESVGQAFDMSTIVADSFAWKKQSYQERPNVIRVEYINRDHDSQWDFAEAFDDWDIDTTGERRERVFRLAGIKRSTQAQRMAYFFLDQAIHVNHACLFRVGIAALQSEVGDVVTVSHDVPGWTDKAFRIMEISEAENDELSLALIEYVPEIYHDFSTGVTPVSSGVTIGNFPPFHPIRLSPYQRPQEQVVEVAYTEAASINDFVAGTQLWLSRDDGANYEQITTSLVNPVAPTAFLDSHVTTFTLVQTGAAGPTGTITIGFLPDGWSARLFAPNCSTLASGLAQPTSEGNALLTWGTAATSGFVKLFTDGTSYSALTFGDQRLPSSGTLTFNDGEVWDWLQLQNALTSNQVVVPIYWPKGGWANVGSARIEGEEIGYSAFLPDHLLTGVTRGGGVSIATTHTNMTSAYVVIASGAPSAFYDMTKAVTLPHSNVAFFTENSRYLYIGASSKFSRVQIDLLRNASNVVSLTMEYSQAGSWGFFTHPATAAVSQVGTFTLVQTGITIPNFPLFTIAIGALFDGWSARLFAPNCTTLAEALATASNFIPPGGRANLTWDIGNGPTVEGFAQLYTDGISYSVLAPGCATLPQSGTRTFDADEVWDWLGPQGVTQAPTDFSSLLYPEDTTSGFLRSGAFLIEPPGDWKMRATDASCAGGVVIASDGASRFWIRLLRTSSLLAVPPVELRVLVDGETLVTRRESNAFLYDTSPVVNSGTSQLWKAIAFSPTGLAAEPAQAPIRALLTGFAGIQGLAAPISFTVTTSFRTVSDARVFWGIVIGSWTAPVTAGNGISGYTLNARIVGTIPFQAYTFPNTTNFIDNYALPGTAFEAQLAAVDRFGRVGDYTALTSFTTPIGIAPTGAVSVLGAGGPGSITAGETWYSGIFDGLSDVLSKGSQTFPVAGVVSHLYARTYDAQPSDGSLRLVIMRDLIETPLSITISAGSPDGVYSDVTHDEVFFVGDDISLRTTNNANSSDSATVLGFTMQYKTFAPGLIVGGWPGLFIGALGPGSFWTTYIPFFGGDNVGDLGSGPSLLTAHSLPVSGILKNLRMWITTSPQPGTGDLVATVLKNNTDTALVVTVPAGSPAPSRWSDLTNAVTFEVGDTVGFKVVNNASSNSPFPDYFTAEYDARSTGDVLAASFPGNTGGYALFGLYGGASGLPLPRAGTVQNLYAHIQQPTSACGTVTVTVRNNGTNTSVQVVTPPGSNGFAVWSDLAHTATFAEGDLIDFEISDPAYYYPINAPSYVFGITMEFVP